ncbi:hypothetical protein L195_g021890 [Trifolium pratense]|uniref:Uncharacterized protein n=1 Tax=Trifolium pratense TaxID=57577 RepID=A0A2K3N6H2_TRIPR|nr:hypothetical protein L195_g021890 [Trifolium pratense]
MTAVELLAAAESLSTGRPSWSHRSTVVEPNTRCHASIIRRLFLSFGGAVNSVDGMDVSTGGGTQRRWTNKEAVAACQS